MSDRIPAVVFEAVLLLLAASDAGCELWRVRIGAGQARNPRGRSVSVHAFIQGLGLRAQSDTVMLIVLAAFYW